MANIIDALVVTLGLDSKDYKKGQREAEESMRKFGKNSEAETKKITEGSKKTAEGFNAVTKSLISMAAIALSVKGVKDFFTGMVNGQASLGRLAFNLGVSAHELDAWGMAVGSVGGTAEGFQKSMQNMQSGFESLKLGENSSVGEAFRAMKINITDASGAMRPMKDLLLDVADAMHRFKAQDQIKIAQMLGLDEGTLNLLRQGRGEVEKTYATMDKLSHVSDASVDSAARAQKSWAALSSTIKGIGENIFAYAIPAMDKMNSVLDRVLKGGDSPWTKFFAGNGEMPKFDWKGLHKSYPWTDPNGGGDPNYSNIQAAKEKKKAQAVTPSSPSGSESTLFANLEKKNSIPSGTLDKLWKIESARGKNMVSPVGATGHFQFMPETAKDFGMSTSDTYDLTKSATAASKYIAQLLKMFNGDMQKAVSAYNWGAGNVQRKGLEHAPLETLNYWKKFNNGNQVTSNKNTSEVSIASLNIYTQATDSSGIARDMKSQLQQNMLITGSATGMN